MKNGVLLKASIFLALFIFADLGGNKYAFSQGEQPRLEIEKTFLHLDHCGVYSLEVKDELPKGPTQRVQFLSPRLAIVRTQNSLVWKLELDQPQIAKVSKEFRELEWLVQTTNISSDDELKSLKRKAQEVEASIDEILLPEQIELVDKAVLEFAINQNGLYRSLVTDAIPKTKLNRSQKRQLVETKPALREELQEKLVAFEEELLQEFFGVLGIESSTEVFLGDRPKYYSNGGASFTWLHKRPYSRARGYFGRAYVKTVFIGLQNKIDIYLQPRSNLGSGHLDEFKFILDPRVQDELKLSDKTRKKLVEKFSPVEEYFRKALDNSIGGSSDIEAYKRFNNFEGEFNGILADVLDEQELDRFKQLQLRRHIRFYGIRGLHRMSLDSQTRDLFSLPPVSTYSRLVPSIVDDKLKVISDWYFDRVIEIVGLEKSVANELKGESILYSFRNIEIELLRLSSEKTEGEKKEQPDR